MAQYINKDALVAKIERRRDAALMRQQNLEAIGQETALNEMIAFELNRIISLIDTLEVKEVDLDEQDVYDILFLGRTVIGEWGDKEYSNEGLCSEVLKRFKAQKGE